MATIFLDLFGGTGAIDQHTPDVPTGGGVWFDPFSESPTGPSAVLSGGLLVVGPNVPAGDIQTVRYSNESGGVGFNLIGLPSSGTLKIEFVTGDSAALTNTTGFNRTIFEAGLVITIGGGTFQASLQQLPDGSFQLQGQPITLLPSTAYELQIVYEPSTIRYYLGSFYYSQPNFFSTPYGVTLAPTSAASFDSVEVNDNVPPPPPPPPPPPGAPADYLYDDFTGDGPMEGRTPDLVAIPGVVWTDTSPTGSAVTLGGNMVAGPGVPADGVASARYGDFATASGGPLTGEIYADILTGPDLSYPVGATGPVTLVEFRFSLSPGTDVSFALVVNPDGSFTVLYSDGFTAPITLTADNTYYLYINYLETEHYVELFDANLSALAFSDSYLYTPVNPSAGYGATELSVNERASIAYYEVYGVPQAEVVNDTDGMDEGVAEDSTDTLNVVTEDVMEAGVGEDYPLPEGETLPEDVREAGLAADTAENQLAAMQIAQDNGVAVDFVPFNIDSTFFRDEFIGTGQIGAHTPEVFFGPLTWFGNSVLSDGLLKATPLDLFTEASYGDELANYNTPLAAKIEFDLITRNLPANQLVQVLSFRINARGRVTQISVQRPANGPAQLSVTSLGATATVNVQLTPNTTYRVVVQYSALGLTVRGLGAAARIVWSGTQEIGLNHLRFFNYVAADIGRIEISRTLPIEYNGEVTEAGYVSDQATPFNFADVREFGVAEDVVDPDGGANLVIGDATDAAVAADGASFSVVSNANGLALGIAADFAPNDYYAVPTETGVAADATNRAVLANQIALDAGIASDATDTRILEDAVAAGVAADATSLAVTLTVRDNGVATDRALPSMTIAADVREAGVAADAALPLSFVDVREAGIAEDVVATRRRTNQAARSDGVAVDSTDPRLAAGALAVAAGVGNDAATTQLVAYSTVIEAGVGDDAGLFGRLYEAWVMNTQTSAMSRYTALPFNSAAVIGGRVIGLGDGGFFELAGTTDAGKPIKALMKSGHLLLGSDNIKRLDDMTVGYTSTCTLQVTVGAYGGPLKGRWTYTAPPVAAVSPRGNRLTLGRGLQAKYYQFTIENTKGSAMSLDFARVISNEFKSRRF